MRGDDMNYYNKNLIDKVTEFSKSNPDSVITNVTLELLNDMAECYIYYLDNNEDEQIHLTTFYHEQKIDNTTDLTKDDLMSFNKIFRKKYGEFCELKGIKKFDENSLFLVIYTEFFSDVKLAIYNKNTHQFYDYLKYRKSLSFEMFILYLKIGYWKTYYFYHDQNNAKIKDVKEILFAIYNAMSFDGIIPSDFHDQFQKHGDLNYKSLWENNELFPLYDLRDTSIFSNFFADGSQEHYSYGSIHMEMTRKVKRNQYNSIRSKYRVEGLSDDKTNKYTHYVFSTIKVFKKYYQKKELKLTYEKIMEICGIVKSSQLHEAFDYLTRNNLIVITKAKQGHYFNVV